MTTVLTNTPSLDGQLELEHESSLRQGNGVQALKCPSFKSTPITSLIRFGLTRFEDPFHFAHQIRQGHQHYRQDTLQRVMAPSRRPARREEETSDLESSDPTAASRKERQQFLGFRASARTHQSVGGRLATGSITSDALAALGLIDHPEGGVVRDPAGAQGVQSARPPSLVAPVTGLRPSIFHGTAGLGGLAIVLAASREASRVAESLEGLIDIDLRYPLPSYKNTKKSKLILAATRPEVQRGRHKDENFVEVGRVPLGDLAMWFALQVSNMLVGRSYMRATLTTVRVPSSPVVVASDTTIAPPNIITAKPSSRGIWDPPETSNSTPVSEFRAFIGTLWSPSQPSPSGPAVERPPIPMGSKRSSERSTTVTERVRRSRWVIVRADDLNHAVILQRGNHQGRTASTEFLETSKILRAYARDQCERLGMTVATVAQHMIEVTQSWQNESLFKLPLWRQIRTIDIKGIFRARSIRNGMLGDPLMALESLSVTRHYDPETMTGDEGRGFVYFQPYIGPTDPPKTASKAKPKSKPTGFTTKTSTGNAVKAPKVKNAKALQSLLAVLAAASCCDDIVRWGRLHGIGIDSSHRHKCENRAPMSIMCTMADDGHVRIGPCAISSDITADTMALYLKEASAAIEKRAEVIVEAHRQGTPIGRDADDQALLLAEATTICETGWIPSHVMIDKSRSELNALRAWGEEMGSPITIRLCQFHIIQAILRWSVDAPTQSERGASKGIKISRIAKLEILDAFRVLQRYRVTQHPASPKREAETDEAFTDRCEEEWKESVHVFAERVNELAIAYAEEGEEDLWYQKVINYFEDNWFTAEWRREIEWNVDKTVSHADLWTDHGMPEGMTRDGFWAQNNRTERLFKFFDDVILGGTCNRRIDHLPLIIIDTLFVYFANFEAINDSIDSVLMASLDLAAEFWESAHFERELEFARAYWVTPVGSETAYLANLTVGECPCTGFAMTGKRCAHMWAADYQDLNGNFEEYNAIAGRNFHHKKRSLTVPPREPEPWRELTDATVKVLTTIAFRRPVGIQSSSVVTSGLTASELAILGAQDDEDDYRFAPVDDAEGDTDASADEALNDEELGGDEDLEFAAASWAADEDLVLATEMWEASTDFVAHPVITGRAKLVRPLESWRSGRTPLKTSLPSAGADRAIQKVMTIRNSDPSGVKLRTGTTAQGTTMFTQKPGTKRTAKGINSLANQIDLDVMKELRDARERVLRLETAASSQSQVPSRPKPRRKAPHPQLPSEPSPKSLYDSKRRVPNAVRNRESGGPSSSQIQPTRATTQSEKASPGKAAAAIAANRPSPPLSDDDDSASESVEVVEAALASLSSAIANPHSKASRDARDKVRLNSLRTLPPTLLPQPNHPGPALEPYDQLTLCIVFRSPKKGGILGRQRYLYLDDLF
ncbi:hypothetical protein P7C70_g2304, partial [Phenoliferia sp. Uapishka_3]